MQFLGKLANASTAAAPLVLPTVMPSCSELSTPLTLTLKVVVVVGEKNHHLKNQGSSDD